MKHSTIQIVAASFLTVWFAGGLAPAADSPAGGWIASVAPQIATAEDAPSQALAFEAADYELDVVASLAAGTLTQRFRNPGEETLQVAYALTVPRGWTVELPAIELDVDGESVELAWDDAPSKQSPGRRARTPRAAPRGGSERRSKAFDVEAGGLVTLRVPFALSLPLDQGRFHMTLPAVHGEAPGEASAPGVSGTIAVTLHHDDASIDVDSPTHEIVAADEYDRTVVELAGRIAASREFTMSFALGSQDDSTLMSFVGPETDGTRDVLLIFAPAVEPPDEIVRPKQVLFVLDTSGSMKPKDKLQRARQALGTCLEKLRPSDSINLLEFDSDFTLFREEPVEWSATSPGQIEGWLGGLLADGGTQLLPALAKVLDQPVDEARHRMIVVLSDGMVADEEQALDLLQRELGDGRLFVVGIGDDVKEETILRLAEYGRGAAVLADDPERLESELVRLFGSVAEPLAWDLSLDWGGAEVEVLGTERIPDLYGGRAVTVRARVHGALPDEVTLSGETMEGPRAFRTVLREAEGASVLSRLPAARRTGRRTPRPERGR